MRTRYFAPRGDAGGAAGARDEAGAVLLLALMFLGAIGLIVGGLATWTANDLSNSIQFQQDRAAQYALSNVTQLAMQNIRYTPLIGANQTLNASPPSYCWGPTPAPGTGTVSEQTVDVNNNNEQITVAAWCSTVWNPSSKYTRVVTVSSCLTSLVSTPNSGSSLTSVQTSAALCAQNPGLQTTVTFDDYSDASPSANPSACLSPPAGTCGAGMTVNNSMIGSKAPTVSSVQAQSGPITGGTVITVTGKRFVPGTTGTPPVPLTQVNFVLTSATANATPNAAIAGQSVSVSSSTQLTVTTPPSTQSGSYFVVVTTANGSSPTSTQGQFTYQGVVPTVTSVAANDGTTTGSAAGGTGITITGKGFIANPVTATSVTFIASDGTKVTAPFIQVNPYTQLPDGTWVQTITATTPGVTEVATYNVVVVVNGISSTNANAQFTFTPLTPLVASVNPTAATTQHSGVVLTITGVGFINGSTTVQLVPTSGHGSTLTLTSVAVSGSTQVTGTVPSGGSNGSTYYVEVTTTSGGPSCSPSGCAGVPTYQY
jgi:hypothetical protein